MGRRQIARRCALAACVVLCALSLGRANAQEPRHYTDQDQRILLKSYRHPQFELTVKAAAAAGVQDFWEKYGVQIPDALNAATYFRKLQNAPFVPISADETASYDFCNDPLSLGPDWQAAQRTLTQPGILQLAHSAARCEKLSPKLPQGQDPLTIIYPELGGCRRSARLITVESIVMARQGKTVAAVRNMSYVMHCADNANDDVGMMGYLVACACHQHAFDGLQDILSISHGAPAVCRAVSAVIRTDYHERHLSDVLRADCAQNIAQIRFWSRGGPQAFSDLSNGVVDQKALGRPDLYKAIVDMNGARVIRDSLANIHAADQPYPIAHRRLLELQNRFDNYNGIDVTFARVMLPEPSITINVTTRIRAATAITGAACAIFLYKSKHNAYPLTLADATSTAIDPFDGKLLGYRRTAKGFVVYSVGPTGKYDGGDFDKKKQHEEVFRYSING